MASSEVERRRGLMNALKVCLDQGRTPRQIKGVSKGVIDPEKMWRDPGDTAPKPLILEVGFLDDDHGLQAEVLRVAREWCRYANVDFASSNRAVADCQV